MIHCPPDCGTAAKDTPAVTHMVLGGKTKHQKLICRLSGLNLPKETSPNPEHRAGHLSFLTEQQTQLSDVQSGQGD